MPTDQFTWAFADAAANSAPAATAPAATHLKKIERLRLTVGSPEEGRKPPLCIHNARPANEVDVCSVKTVAEREAGTARSRRSSCCCRVLQNVYNFAARPREQLNIEVESSPPSQWTKLWKRMCTSLLTLATRASPSCARKSDTAPPFASNLSLDRSGNKQGRLREICH